jgi:flagellar protein FlgJ
MDGLSSYYDTLSSSTNSSNRASSTTSALSGLSSDSSEEELTEAVESFESYMLEQVLKELKDTFTSEDEDEDSTMSQYTDMYMDATIQELAQTMVSQYGGNLTEELVEQMKRNYGIE